MKKLFTALILVAMTMMSQAQSFKVSTGSSSGTYSRIIRELSPICANAVQITEMNSTGSMENIDRITGNVANSALVQSDVLAYRARNEDLGNIKTLVSLFPEEIHIVSLATLKTKEGGTLGFGAKAVQLSTINDLVGRTVVAAGGSFITAQVIRLQTEIGFNVIEAPNTAAALKAVADGTAHAAIIVGGQPMADITALDKNFRLLSIPETVVAKLKSIYKPARVTYSKMGAQGVTTVSVDSLFVVRAYTTPKFIDAAARLRACFIENVATIAEEPGMAPAWSKIDVTNQGKWAYYQLPTRK